MTVTVRGGLVDVLDALCMLEGCDAGEFATEVLLKRLRRVQDEDPDVRGARSRPAPATSVAPSRRAGALMSPAEAERVPTGNAVGGLRSAAVECAIHRCPVPSEG